MFEQTFVVTHQLPMLDGYKKQMKIKDRESCLPRNTMGKRWAEDGLVARPDAGSPHLAGMTANDATFAMVDAMMQHAIQDAIQSSDPFLRGEALAWLWVCCPDIADQLRLPWPEATDVQQKAAAYMDRRPAY